MSTKPEDDWTEADQARAVRDATELFSVPGEAWRLLHALRNALRGLDPSRIPEETDAAAGLLIAEAMPDPSTEASEGVERIGVRVAALHVSMLALAKSQYRGPTSGERKRYIGALTALDAAADTALACLDSTQHADLLVTVTRMQALTRSANRSLGHTPTRGDGRSVLDGSFRGWAKLLHDAGATWQEARAIVGCVKPFAWRPASAGTKPL